MTEFGAVTAMPMGDRGQHLGSVGLPLPGVEIRIVGPDGTILPPGEVGRVTLGGTRPARSYLGDEENATEAWVDGWLRSGDLGYLDTDGHLWIVGREKEIIIRGGHNVVPGEVEAALFEHPAVVEAAVTRRGARRSSARTWRPGWSPATTRPPPTCAPSSSIDLADYKVPRRITVVDALPRNESGKVLKSLLRSGVEPE